MISEENNKGHQKHAQMSRANLGEFGRNELAILGTTCANIRQLATTIIQALPGRKVAFIDADHKSDNTATGSNNTLSIEASMEYTDKISHNRIDFKGSFNVFERRNYFNDQDLVIINGNHFKGTSQVVVIDPVKDLEKKREQLTNVVLIILQYDEQQIPEFLQSSVNAGSIPVIVVSDIDSINDFFGKYVHNKQPQLNGLVLSGGLSTRMQQDKGNLQYHGISQRHYLYNLLSQHCSEVFVSCNAQQSTELKDSFPIIEDRFLGLGPMGGILSAFQSNPNVAWLVVACDLPFLSNKTLESLINNRNTSKAATAFFDSKGEFPEPMVAIWEPKSYLTLLQFLQQGYSCPRKVLINADVELLSPPDDRALMNANSPDDYNFAIRQIQHGNFTGYLSNKD